MLGCIQGQDTLLKVLEKFLLTGEKGLVSPVFDERVKNIISHLKRKND